jgi:hypothetical protein
LNSKVHLNSNSPTCPCGLFPLARPTCAEAQLAPIGRLASHRPPSAPHRPPRFHLPLSDWGTPPGSAPFPLSFLPLSHHRPRPSLRDLRRAHHARPAHQGRLAALQIESPTPWDPNPRSYGRHRTLAPPPAHPDAQSSRPRRGPAAPPHPSSGQAPRQLPPDARQLPDASTLDFYAGSGRNLTETRRR